MIFIVQLRLTALDPSDTVHVQGPPRAIYTFVPLGLQFLARTLAWPTSTTLQAATSLLLICESAL